MKNIIIALEKLSPLITVIISSAISYFIARFKVKSEINKYLITLGRKDQEEFRELFSSLITSAQEYCDFPCGESKSDISKYVSKLILISPYNLIPILNELDSAAQNRNFAKIQELRSQLLKLIK